MAGLISYASYIPYYRLDRATIRSVLGRGGGRGERAVASYDEDSATMGVAAAQQALAACWLTGPGDIDELLFSTSSPPYMEKSNATAIHAALNLDASVLAIDAGGSLSAAGPALRRAADSAALGRTAVTVLADVRSGRPGSADESQGGDGAAAFVWANSESTIAELLGSATRTLELLDRWRLPTWQHNRVWDERFVEAALLPSAREAADVALESAALTPADVHHLVISSARTRVADQLRRDLTGEGAAVWAGDLLRDAVGYTGVADFGLSLVAALDVAGPNEVLLAVVIGDGAQAFVLRTAPTYGNYVPTTRLADQIAAKDAGLAYSSFLSWRGYLEMEPPRRPEAMPPAAPPSLRANGWKFGFVGAECGKCGTRQMPPSRVCSHCGAIDQMTHVPMSRVRGRLTTYTVDHLSPQLVPTIGAIVDFDGGGRAQLEVTDADPETLRVGDPVEMTFRRVYTAGGVHNYFWKARPSQVPHEKEGR